MTDPSRAQRESSIRQLLERGDATAATSVALELYGPEVCGFLHAVARDDDLAADAFAGFCEDLWRGLAGFRWESSLRTWAYALARHALYRQRRSPGRRLRDHVELDNAREVLERAEAIRTVTLQFLRTEVKDGLRRLRDELAPDDHELLILRIDRRLSWREVAQAMPGESEEPIDQRAAALRKRFERTKSRLRAMAAERGLLGDP